MTTYGDNTANRFYHLVRKGYRYTYALINYTTGEVYTQSCDKQYLPLKNLYNRFDGIRRESAFNGEACEMVLVNCRTGEVLAQEGGAA